MLNAIGRRPRWTIFFFFAISVSAQTSRITTAVDNTKRVALAGNIHPNAQPLYDRGRVSPSLELDLVTLQLGMTASQKAGLQQLLSDQQKPSSPDYHHWLTPEEYASRFGASEDDIQKITAWLQTQGFKVSAVARARNWIAGAGSAATVGSAFKVELHQYVVNGETHFANSNEPSIPAAFGGVVINLRGLNDFRMKPAGRLKRALPNGNPTPAYTASDGSHYITPDDLAVIYNIKPLFAESIDGTGMKIAVAGQTQIDLSDIEQFRTKFSLSSNDPAVTLVPYGRNPGIRSDDLPEADLDLEWSGAVARNATIVYVYTSDVMNSVQYAIDENLAPVITDSYGLCEPETGGSEAYTMQSWAQQANSEGITWLAASGDNGAADCGDSQNPGVAVDVPASIPEVTGVGGTEFTEGSAQFWSSTNGSTLASALSYIPETAWNDSAEDQELTASGGGASVLFTKPSWQTGTGVPGDNARHVPDLSLSASADHDGYLVYTGGQLQVYGGTSVPTPIFAGITALANEALLTSGKLSTAGLGNVNPELYWLAQTASSVFHDVTTGNNIVTVSCSMRPSRCNANPVGYRAGVGYDQVTGLGSVDAFNLVTAWNGGTVTSTPNGISMTLTANLATVAPSQIVFLITTIASADGITPTGTVTLTVDGSTLGSAALVGSAGTGTATLAISGSQLGNSGGIITASYGGDSATAGGSASTTVSVSSTPAISSVPAIEALTNGASFKPAYAPGMIVSLFGSGLAPSTQTAGSIPLPITMAGVAATVNGVAAPIYYVSPTQINLQIPYEIPAGAATMTVNNNGQVTSQTLTVATAAPGIFTNINGQPVPDATATRGQRVTLYITGAGGVSPAIATGAAAASGTALADLPKPTQTVSVSVGGVATSIDFIGIPSGIVGAVQINYLAPAGAAVGMQPVVVTVDGRQSAAAYLNVTN